MATSNGIFEARRLAAFLGVMVMVLVGSGCTAAGGPEVLTIDASDYARAFDVAMETTSDEGFRLVLRDRRSGVIETDPVIAGSLLEPWRADESTAAVAMTNTVNLQRRRARIEFRPATFADTDPEDPMLGPDLLSLDDPPTDFTRDLEGPIEIRAWVWIERSYVPGRRRFSWSRTSTSSMKIIDPDTGQTTSSSHWTPVSRDEDFERLLLRRMQERLDASYE